MFDLEIAIKAWKKDLAKVPSLEDTYILELEAVLRDEVDDLIQRGKSEEEAFIAASSAMGSVQEIGDEFSKVRGPLGWRRASGKSPLVMPALLWNYILVTLRKIRRQKGYSFINISGLAVGLACCILMMLWIQDEMSFDRFHVHRDSIFRLIAQTESETGLLLDARTPTPLGPAVASQYPEVMDFCRYQGEFKYGIRYQDKAFFDDSIASADPSFFSMFTFPFITGDPRTALNDPRSIVITESMARKYFGDDEPMGKILMLPNGRDAYSVTGVIQDVPRNSHLHFDCVIPLDNMQEYHHVDYTDWTEVFFYLYVRLDPRASPLEAAKKMSTLIAAKTGKSNSSLRLQPLKDVHLKSNFAWDLDNYAQGSYSTLTIFALAAAVILLLACINFMNLSTARSANRGKEIGLRKIAGAVRSDVIEQFLGESVVMSGIGLILALVLVWLALPAFNALGEKHLTMSRLADPGLFLGLLGITLLTGLMAGSYPALFLASFQPAKVLKGGWLSGGRGQAVLRKSLVVVQFTLTVFLVIGTIVVDKQLKYIRNKDLGIDTNRVLTLLMRAPYEVMRNAFLADPGILGMTQSLPPGEDVRSVTDVSWEGKSTENDIHFYPVHVDPDYIETFRLEMVEGRFFSREIASDRTEAVVLNQEAARVMGIESPVGKRMTIAVQTHTGAFEQRPFKVIGVMKDYHQRSLHQPIEPTLFTYTGDQWPWINVRISPYNTTETLNFLEKTWKTIVPNFPLSYDFIDDRVHGFYKLERRTKSILGVFTILALFTASLGLSGLASFIAEKRTKEIGIRKVLGASTRGLVIIQAREFAAWVLLANAVAWPAAYYAIGRWLQGFAYRVSPGIEPALMAVVFSLTIALLSVGYKAIRAALADPVESLKYE